MIHFASMSGEFKRFGSFPTQTVGTTYVMPRV